MSSRTSERHHRCCGAVQRCMFPPGGWSPTGTRSSLTLRRDAARECAMSGFYKYAQAEPDFVAVIRTAPSTRGRPARAGEPVRPPAAVARAREGRQRRRRAAQRREAGRGVPRRAPGRLVLRADQLPAVGSGSPTSSRTPARGGRVARALRRGHLRGRRAGRRARRGSARPGRSPASRRRGRARRAADTLPEDRAAGAAMHYTSGTTGKPKGVSASCPTSTPT